MSEPKTRSLDQRVARIAHEACPAWWNGLTDGERAMYSRAKEALLSAAFEAGVRAALQEPADAR